MIEPWAGVDGDTKYVVDELGRPTDPQIQKDRSQ
ncbi:hypothetical protein SAMN05444714_0191 [Yoonia litorea]|uniref:Uncharacterized protein n=1 Tax=Yoonia litorea TaxID=1123755 RepID=A0A1I6L5G3_9RHOB|nr:hypothetical protein SAMN05444714_0191 [Yoonia litorea]